MKLDHTQNSALREIQENLADTVASLPSMEEELRELEGPPSRDLLWETEFANTFGILGPRGAGKSTLLRHLFDGGKKWRAIQKSFDKLFILAPIDCSVVPEDVAPGAAILLHLADQLQMWPQSHEGRGEEEALRKELCDLAERYSETTESYRKLGLELASSPGDYTHFIMQGMSRRFHLRDDLRKWLVSALRRLQRSAFVVLLDDFDLVHANEVRRWILSLLDELHQRRLLFVLTADYYRLEHLSWDPQAEFDDKTGRALLDKLLPSQNRCNLERWELAARESFFLTRPKAQGDALGVLIEDFSRGVVAQRLLLRRLLPGWPRGLVNLHQALIREKRRSSAVTASSGAGFDEEVTNPSSLSQRLRIFLGLLASCRGEPLLARRLQKTPVAAWVRILQFNRHEISVEEWQEMVEIAAGRREKTSLAEFRPMQLMPLPPRTAERTPGHDETEGSRYEIQELINDYEPVLYDSSDHDPLRHDDLRIRPLRDAQDSIQPYWAELLLNYGFFILDTATRGEALRNRSRFLESWGPAVSRLRQARFAMTVTRDSLRELFEDPRFQLPRASLLWLFWEPGEEPTVEIGWYPLLSALRGARDPLLSDQLADLLIGDSALEGDLPPIGSVDELCLLPDQLWAMILVVDGLERCPWRAFSSRQGWSLPTYLQLAVVFVRSAYVHALKACGLLAENDLSPSQQRICQILESRNPASVPHFEEDALAWMAELFADDLAARLKDRQDSLSIAAAAFLRSQAYRSVVDLASQIL